MFKKCTISTTPAIFIYDNTQKIHNNEKTKKLVFSGFELATLSWLVSIPKPISHKALNKLYDNNSIVDFKLNS